MTRDAKAVIAALMTSRYVMSSEAARCPFLSSSQKLFLAPNHACSNPPKRDLQLGQLGDVGDAPSLVTFKPLTQG
jgi:hypothetical protein